MPTLNYARSCRAVAGELSQALERHNKDNDCVYAAINPGQRASFYVFDQLQFSDQRSCPLWLQETSPKYSTEERSRGDRKSTRLNSSHVASSYAVFCLKKKRYKNSLKSQLTKVGTL